MGHGVSSKENNICKSLNLRDIVTEIILGTERIMTGAKGWGGEVDKDEARDSIIHIILPHWLYHTYHKPRWI